MFFQSLVWAVVGALIALWLEKMFKSPKLKIVVSEDANQDHIYPEGVVVVPGRWKFFRVRVVNKGLPKIFSFLTIRETAQQMNAVISFKEIGMSMKGRWAESLELPFANQSDILRLINFPDPFTIFPGESTILDVFAKYEKDGEAYGWNNEAYLNKWRTPGYKLPQGNYLINIRIIGVNAQVSETFQAHIGKTIEKTHIKPLE